jgi:hypothetical protein
MDTNQALPVSSCNWLGHLLEALCFRSFPLALVVVSDDVFKSVPHALVVVSDDVFKVVFSESETANIISLVEVNRVP